jgi:uncharacterized membrane protein YcaP (DUF421 family)
MKKFEIHLADWQRILFGQTPPEFLLEVFIRTLVIYVVLLLVLRWLGKRMSGQLTILEMAVMLTLGAIVSVAMQVPERGITLSLFVLSCTLLFQRGLSHLGYKSARIEELTQGRISTLVKDGVLEIEEMRRCRISHQQLFSDLRSKNVMNLGEVRRIYLEACGLFSIIKNQQPVAGLSTLPPGDVNIISALHYNNEMACCNCGKTSSRDEAGSNTCPRCGADDWTQAVNI